MKVELCEVAQVIRVSDRVMAVVLVFEEDMLRLIRGYFPQSGRCSLRVWCRSRTF